MPHPASVAIIGIGCRFPGGANSPAAFWRLLCDEVDAIREIPADRWNVDTFFDPTPGRKGKTVARAGGFLDAIDQFDAGFFGLSPREAASMDPQQRLLLQTAWEALEDGGVVLDPREPAPIGTFVGISTNDYSQLQSSLHELGAIDLYTATGTATSIAANRLSYCLNLRGPSIAVDTACSSSLVALHLACTSLWNGDCALALAAGVNVIIGVSPYISFSRCSMLSPDGRCRAFDARANGYVRGEGVGVVALKPLAAALTDGNPIYAVIRATAVNQDGRTNGITLPNAVAQENLVREACLRAGVLSSQVQYVEAHGTGTPVGDPIEAYALGSALGREREDAPPCLIGSVKTNIGHLEAAAGVAGVIKVALALHHGRIPASLHFQSPNPNIDFERWHIRVPTTLESFRKSTELPIAGVNSFGFGGTNAHAILQAAPRRTGEDATPGPPGANRDCLLVLSARSADALRTLAESYQSFLSSGNGCREPRLEDICYTAGAHRAHHAHRLSLSTTSREAAAGQLAAFLAGESRPGLSTGQPADQPGVVFVCSGQGPQWSGMGAGLQRDEAVFRAKLEECDTLFRKFGDWSLLEELARDEGASRLDETAIAQPAIFAMQVALAALLESWGIRPGAVVGHSVGEAAAAHIAGALELREAARIVFERGRCMEEAAGHGRMLAVALAAGPVDELIAPWRGRVEVGALNSPASVTLSGDGDVLERIAAELERRSIFCRFLRVNYAFHSRQMEPARDELLRVLGRIEVRPTKVPLYSSVTGVLANADDFGTEYWWHNVRRPVRFAPAIGAMLDAGHRHFLEMSPHPVLGGSILECLKHRAQSGVVIPTLRRHEAERTNLLATLGTLHVLGSRINWRTLYPDASAIRLPNYAWQQERFWTETEESRAARLNPSVHPLLAQPVGAADPTWQTSVDLEVFSYLKDHRIQDRVVFPAAGYVEMALGAASAVFPNAPCVIEDFDFQKALALAEGDDSSRVQLCVRPQESTFAISSRTSGEGRTWTTHAVGRLRAHVDGAAAGNAALDDWRRQCSESIPVETIYSQFSDAGIGYGPTFRCLQSIAYTDGAALGQVRLPEQLQVEVGNYRFHPALLDACFQTVIAVVPATAREKRPSCYLPVQIERVRFFARPGTVVLTHARRVRWNDRSLCADLTITDETGRILMLVDGFVAQAVAPARGDGADQLDEPLYVVRWKPVPLMAPVRAAAALAPTHAILARMRRFASRMRAQHQFDTSLREAEPQIDALCRHYILDAFLRTGWRLRAGEDVTLAPLAERLGVVARHHRVFARYLGFLERDGILRRNGAAWTVLRSVAPVDTDVLWNQLIARFPRVLPELVLLRRCGRHLAEVLQDRLDPLKLLFPDGSLASAEHLYQDSDSFRGSNLLVGEAVAAAIAHSSNQRVRRILEIGAGTGGMSAHVLPRLPREQTEYVFTDLSNLFLAKAEQKFFGHSFVRYQLLDIEKPPHEQKLEPHSFDIVLASDAIHATQDLRTTLGHVRSLLAPGGLLVLLEVDGTPRWPDLVFGLTEGWWRFTDTDIRPGYPLLDRRRWLDLFRECGFVDTGAVSDQGGRSHSGQTVFLARAPEVAVECPSIPAFEIPIAQAPATWLVFADRSGVSEKVASRLAARGYRSVLAFAGSEFRAQPEASRYEIRAGSPEDLRQLIDHLRESGEPPLAAVLHLWSLDASEESLAESEALCGHSLVALTQALALDAAAELPRLWVITRGAQAASPTDPVAPIQATTWGLARVLCNERPKFRCRLIDLAPSPLAAETDALLRELFAADAETEIALRADSRYANRIVRTQLGRELSRPRKRGSADAFRLEISTPGALDRLVLRAHRRRPPGPGEVEIEVKAASLNFRDVLKTLGIYPTEDERDELPGDECAGCVVAVGPGVTHLRSGDDVVAIAPGCFASHVTTRAEMAWRKPPRLDYDEAATMPVAFLTAWYALHHLGRIRRGERVLIHAATGGVGLAAIQIARLAGAGIYATAGSEEKREFLRALGVKHVMDSRTLAFADEVRALTGGRGVDLVLNSLSGEAIVKGIAALAPNGRFLEIGKRDVYQNARLGLRALRHNVSFHVIDLGRVLQDEPKLVASLLKRVLAHSGKGRLRPLPLRLFQLSQAVNALRHMSQARHIGKVVLDLQHVSRAEMPAPEPPPTRFRRDATYLITGGFGGLGLVTAEWMLLHGARHIVLASRRGASTEETRHALQHLQRNGDDVVALQVDVSDPRDVSRMFRTIARRMPPLRGIFHTAMVLDDGTIAQLDPGRFHRAMAAKAWGAWHLHSHSVRLDLDFFVFFSSVGAILGSPGQGNYAAANAFLEALAHHRRTRGLPALTIDWGMIADVGVAARNTKVEEALRHHGLVGIKPLEAARWIGRLLPTTAAQIAVYPVDWRKWLAFTPATAPSPRYSELAVPAAEPTAEAGGAREAILAMPPAERLAAITAQLTAIVAKVLRTSPARLNVQRPLNELGLDSLMAIELLDRIERHFATPLPAGSLSASTFIAKMAGDLLVAIGGAPAAASAPVLPLTAHAAPAPQPLEATPLLDCAVTLRADGALPPLFCIHPTGGLVNVYGPLATLLGDERPVIGIQSRALSPALREHETITAMAEDYARLICGRQPDGPCHLLGFSLGGLFAIEVARALESAGRIVALVALIDTDLRMNDPAFLRTRFLHAHIAAMYETFAQALTLLKPLDRAGTETVAARLVTDLSGVDEDAWPATIGQWLHNRGYTRPEMPAALLAGYLEIFSRHVRLVQRYTPPVLAAPLAVWSGEARGDAATAWRSHTKTFTLEHVVSGEHYELLRLPLVETIATQLAAALEHVSGLVPAGAP